VLASFRIVTWRDEPAVFTIFYDISEQLAAEAALDASERRLVAQSDALTSLTARYTNPGEPFGERLLSILEIAARALQVERLSMWRFEDQGSSIHCVGLYRRAGEQSNRGPRFIVSRLPITSRRSSASGSLPPPTPGPTAARASSWIPT
jgi:hypothetical protein